MELVAIVRHGQYLRLEGQNDGHLTEEGEQTTRDLARALAWHFAGMSSGIIFCSPLIRSKETARLIVGLLGGCILEDPRIADPRMDLNVHFTMHKSPICNPDGLSTGEVYALMQQPQGFETYTEVNCRSSEFIAEKVIASFYQGIVVVTHAPTFDYLLLRHFQTGLCFGEDLGYGEILLIKKKKDTFFLSFRGVSLKTDREGMLFSPRFIMFERERRGFKAMV